MCYMLALFHSVTPSQVSTSRTKNLYFFKEPHTGEEPDTLLKNHCFHMKRFLPLHVFNGYITPAVCSLRVRAEVIEKTEDQDLCVGESLVAFSCLFYSLSGTLTCSCCGCL